MSMLAGPRRKQKVINLRAKNNAWSNDNSKFGQRMLEKMGWSEGKGLGLKENGIVEHVVAKYKNDDKGLGFEDRNDQWTKHEDDFNSLLANLSNGDANENKLHSGISLEDKSKKSKARVHYHKFTRGKDLTRYSEKDLANIFGKKSLKSEEKIEKPLKEDIKTTNEQVFTEKGSMEDYFKNKIAVIKSKNKIQKSDDNENYNEADYMFRGFSETTIDEDKSETHQGFGFNLFYEHATDYIHSEKKILATNDSTSKIIKKLKKNDSNEEVSKNLIKRESLSLSDSIDDCDNNKKRKKKKKAEYQKLESMEEDHIENFTLSSNYSNLSENCTSLIETVSKKKTSKSKKGIQNEDSPDIETTENENLVTGFNLGDTHDKKKKIKKVKYKQLQEEAHKSTTNILEKQDDCDIPKKKKKRKNKEVNN